ncbi:hypothetical protein FQA39_LY01045 [Lamprigera yunnana]|nr:hypothetical protein FQA39_LY01045 [Lamprigera yunnana]
MYKPPENSNRVKAIKIKFESNTTENTILPKPPLRKSRTLQDFSVPSKHIQEKAQINKSDVKNTQQGLSRQLSDPTKRNIKRTPAFRLDRTSESSAGFMQNKTRYLEKIAKNNNHTHDENKTETNTFSNIRNKFNVKPSITIKHKDKESRDPSPNLKFLYSEPIPKSQRNKSPPLDDITDIHHIATLKISETKTVKEIAEIISLKKIEDESLTDTLKVALRKPLPKGPAPKKPPRTFLHSPNNTELKLVHSNITVDFAKKLNTDLQKNLTSPRDSKKSRSDPKYMLDKLENALKGKGVLRKSRKSDLSEDESDNEKYKFNFRDLPALPSSPSAPSSSPDSPHKFNLNCLPSLSCSNSQYTAVKEPNSSFFVTCTKEEPVYAEPFEYQLDVGQKNCHSNASAIENVVADSSNTKASVRRSVHYANKESVIQNYVLKMFINNNKSKKGCLYANPLLLTTLRFWENTKVTSGSKLDLFGCVHHSGNKGGLSHTQTVTLVVARTAFDGSNSVPSGFESIQSSLVLQFSRGQLEYSFFQNVSKKKLWNAAVRFLIRHNGLFMSQT